jgi:hypothetical protein
MNDEMRDEKPAEDFAEILKKHFATIQNTTGGKPRWVMSEKNRRKLERIKQRVDELRGQ